MGRKIPGKKHKGVKDPEKQRAKRQSELATKINAPPKNVDDQDIPRSLERLIKLKNAVKNGSIVQKRRKKKKGKKLIRLGAEQNVKLHPKAKPEKIVPIFNQRPDENEHQFWHRVNKETNAFVKETEFETKYNVQVKRNPETGHIEGVVKTPKDEIEQLKAKHKNIKKKKKVSKENGAVKLTKSQKKKEKLLNKQERKDQNDFEEFKTFKDKVEFGEVVHAPPELTVLPRNADKTVNRTKVKTKGLLLNSLLEQNNPGKIEKKLLASKSPLEQKESEKTEKKSIDRTGKRKDLPVGERRQLEKQQNEAIAAYRLLKARQRGETT